MIVGVIAIQGVLKSYKYKAAESCLAEKDYQGAIELFTELKDYKDSAERLTEAKYLNAAELFNTGNYVDAAVIYADIVNYKDSADKRRECHYINASNLYSKGDYSQAKTHFEMCGYGYKNTNEMLKNCNYYINYETAKSYYTAKNYREAAEAFKKLGAFSNSAEMFENSKYMLYDEAIKQLQKGDYNGLYQKFQDLANTYNYKDSAQRAKNIKNMFDSISNTYYHYNDYYYIQALRYDYDWTVRVNADYTTGKVNIVYSISGNTYTEVENAEYAPSGKYTSGSYSYIIGNGFVVRQSGYDSEMFAKLIS